MGRIVGPPIGYAVPLEEGIVVPLVNAYRYSVLELDHGRLDSGTLSAVPGSADSVLGRADELTEAGTNGKRIHVVLQENATAGKRCRAILVGVTRMVVGGAVVPGDSIVLGDAADITGKRIRARVLESGGVDGALRDVLVWFDGESGFGQVAAGGGGGGGGGDPGGGRPPGGFDTGSYVPGSGIAYSGTGLPPYLGFGGVVEF